jgi:hypothetical protein
MQRRSCWRSARARASQREHPSLSLPLCALSEAESGRRTADAEERLAACAAARLLVCVRRRAE